MLVLLSTLAIHVSAQISVAPPRILINPGERSYEMMVENSADVPVTVTASLGFQLMRTDSAGIVSLDTMARTGEESLKSCRDWIKISPKKFTIPVKGSRTVRVIASVPPTAADGEYWGRLILLSQRVLPPEALKITDGDSIKTEITVALELNLPIIVRKGAIETGIELQSISARQDTNGCRLLVDTHRSGNSAYRGTLFATVKSADGSSIATAREPFTTEFELRQALKLPRLNDGNYTVDLECRSVKGGTAADAVIPAATVNRSYELHIAGERVELSPQSLR